MIWATLGTISFSTRLGWTGYQHSAGAEYAEHVLARGKPRLQFMGEKLAEIRVEFGLHNFISDPQAELQRLRDAKAKGQAMALVFGNGDYRGRFVIVDLEHTLTQTDGLGNLISLTGSMTLKEFIGDPAVPEDAPARAPVHLPAGAALSAPPYKAPIPPVGLSAAERARWAMIRGGARRTY